MAKPSKRRPADKCREGIKFHVRTVLARTPEGWDYIVVKWGEVIRAFSGAPRSDVINVVLCLPSFCYSYPVGKALTLVRGSNPRIQSLPRVDVQKNHPTRSGFFGVPDWIRTNGTKRRRLVLYPAELRIRTFLFKPRRKIGAALFKKVPIFYYFLLSFCKRL